MTRKLLQIFVIFAILVIGKTEISAGPINKANNETITSYGNTSTSATSSPPISNGTGATPLTQLHSTAMQNMNSSNNETSTSSSNLENTTQFSTQDPTIPAPGALSSLSNSKTLTKSNPNLNEKQNAPPTPKFEEQIPVNSTHSLSANAPMLNSTKITHTTTRTQPSVTINLSNNSSYNETNTPSFKFGNMTQSSTQDPPIQEFGASSTLSNSGTSTKSNSNLTEKHDAPSESEVEIPKSSVGVTHSLLVNETLNSTSTTHTPPLTEQSLTTVQGVNSSYETGTSSSQLGNATHSSTQDPTTPVLGAPYNVFSSKTSTKSNSYLGEKENAPAETHSRVANEITLYSSGDVHPTRFTQPPSTVVESIKPSNEISTSSSKFDSSPLHSSQDFTSPLRTSHSETSASPSSITSTSSPSVVSLSLSLVSSTPALSINFTPTASPTSRTLNVYEDFFHTLGTTPNPPKNVQSLTEGFENPTSSISANNVYPNFSPNDEDSSITSEEQNSNNINIDSVNEEYFQGAVG